MAIDKDGTQGYFINVNNVVVQLTAAQMQTINNEDESSVTFNVPDSTNNNRVMLWFPEKRDLDGFFLAADKPVKVDVSTDTTNGLDGTWTNVKSTYTPPFTPASPAYRQQIQSITALGIRAVRMTFDYAFFATRTLKAFHVFGEQVPGANPNRLTLWHPTLDQRVTPAYFDWGDTPRSSSADKQFRVKNLSDTLTANSIRVAQDVLSDATPSVPGQHTLSTDGVTFLAQVNVGNLAPGAISGVVTFRRNTPSNAQLGVWTHRVFAEANTWS